MSASEGKLCGWFGCWDFDRMGIVLVEVVSGGSWAMDGGDMMGGVVVRLLDFDGCF